MSHNNNLLFISGRVSNFGDNATFEKRIRSWITENMKVALQGPGFNITPQEIEILKNILE